MALAIPVKMRTKEAKEEMERDPVSAEIKISKC